MPMFPNIFKNNFKTAISLSNFRTGNFSGQKLSMYYIGFEQKLYCKHAKRFHILPAPFSYVQGFMLTTCDHILLLASTSGTSPPRGPPLWKIYVIISQEPANSDKAEEIPVAEDVQDTNPKYSDAKVVEDLVSEDSKVALLQLGGDSNHSE